jgi:hypothetical protein
MVFIGLLTCTSPGLDKLLYIIFILDVSVLRSQIIPKSCRRVFLNCEESLWSVAFLFTFHPLDYYSKYLEYCLSAHESVLPLPSPTTATAC